MCTPTHACTPPDAGTPTNTYFQSHESIWKKKKKPWKNCFFTPKLHRCLIISADLYVNSRVANKKRLWRTTHTVHIKRNPLHIKLRLWQTDLPSNISSNPPPIQADSTVEIQLLSPDIITEKRNDFSLDFQSSGFDSRHEDNVQQGVLSPVEWRQCDVCTKPSSVKYMSDCTQQTGVSVNGDKQPDLC